MYSITLQTNDTVVSSGDILGRLQFAASAEADGGASQLIGAGIYGMGEGSFGSSSNPASLVFITSADDSNAAVPRIKISEDGDIIPIQGSHNIGESGNSFNTIYATGLDTRYIALASNVPADTTNKLYNDNGTLKFNGSSIGGAGGGGLNDLIDDTSPQLGANLDINTYSVTGVGNINIDGDITAENFHGDLDGPIVVECKNQTGSDIAAGTPVYVSGYYGTNGKASVAPADAADPSKMPAIGIIETALTSDSEGHVHCFGLSTRFDTSSFTVGQTVYVASGGGLTNSRPNGATDLVQNIGRVLRSDASQGRILVLGPGRTNDTPNSLDVTGTITAPNIGTGEDDSVVVLDSDGKLRTDEIDSRVWGTSLLANVVEDTFPQLGGNLDLQTYDISSDGTTGGDLKIGYTPQPQYYTLITDNANTRVGINISSPSYALDIGTRSGGNSSSAIRARNYIILNSFNITNGSNADSSTTPMGSHYSPLVVGYGAKPFTSKCTSYATNYFSSAGDAQKVSMVVQYESTDATTKYLNAAKTGGYLYSTYVRNDTFILPPDSSATFTIHLIANNDTDSTSAGWTFRGCVKSVNKFLSFVGSPIVENFNDAGMSGATADIEVQDGSGVSAFRVGGLLIKVNGLSGKTIRWVATIDAVLTSF